MRYFKESYESSHHRRVIENKLDGKSYRAWFEDPNLVHFIQKDYFSCSTKEGFQIFPDDAREPFKIVLMCGEFESPIKPMSDFKSPKNDIPLVWYDHYHLGKTEHIGKTEFSS